MLVKWIENDILAMENISSTAKKSFSILSPSKYEVFSLEQNHLSRTINILSRKILILSQKKKLSRQMDEALFYLLRKYMPSYPIVLMTDWLESRVRKTFPKAWKRGSCTLLIQEPLNIWTFLDFKFFFVARNVLKL